MARTIMTARKTTGGTASRRMATRLMPPPDAESDAESIISIGSDAASWEAPADRSCHPVSSGECNLGDMQMLIFFATWPQAMKMKRLPASSAIKATDSMVVVEVGSGDKAQTFHVHATQLRESSEYLKAKEKPEWSKGKAMVDLSHQDPAAFNIYANWLYTGQILSAAAKKAHASEEWLGLARAFTPDEELIDQDFKNAIMSALSTSASEAEVVNFLDCMGDLVTIIYDGTPDGSLARRFLVDLGKALEREQLSKLRGGLHADFTFDLALAGAKADKQGNDSRKRKRQPFGTIKEGMCHYHEHEAGQECQQ